MTRQLSPDLCLLAGVSWMISGLSTSAERGALITSREIETKFNSFFLRGENKPSDSPASVWHTVHLHRANSTQKWKEHGKKVTLSVHLLWNLLNVQEYAVVFIQEGKKNSNKTPWDKTTLFYTLRHHNFKTQSQMLFPDLRNLLASFQCAELPPCKVFNFDVVQIFSV